ncbi:hypothetical protein H7F51_13160 [Novosphingobium flavum]|uniref:Uncharacterized protein n=1 Tax=Novosphingobium flavum TaxID=1778672 RepID=A0A7X1FT57_9SPHN|nr:hypothetical protein [Novosphingobium flavum]MBC2666471.1 hypothetical protein [Novosphingobium flavum]
MTIRSSRRNLIDLTGLALSLYLAFVMGFRMPNLWSANYYLPSLQDGFHRRMVVGTLLYPLGDWRFRYATAAALSIMILCALLSAILISAWRGDRRQRLLVCLFLLGPAGGFLFHEIGYLDLLLYLIAIALIAFTGNGWLSSGLLAGTVFVHEVAAFAIMPLVIACRFLADQDLRKAARSAAICTVTVAFYLAVNRTAEDAVVRTFVRVLASKADFIPRFDFWKSVYLQDNTHNFWVITDMPALICAATLALLAGMAAADGQDRRIRALNFVACFGAGIAPLLIGFVGWDTSRWIFLSLCSSSTLLFCARVRPISYYLAYALITFFMLLLVPLDYFDGYSPRSRAPRSQVDFLSRELPRELRQLPSR